jgi:hypothetical protein
MADISHAYAMEPIVIFDLSRTQADKIDHVYSLIAGTKIFKPPRRDHRRDVFQKNIPNFFIFDRY